MSGSDDIKEALAEDYGTNIKAWKRVSKKNVDGNPLRVFKNVATGLELLVEGDEYDGAYEVGPLCFGIGEVENAGFHIKGVCVSFAPIAFWERECCIPDWHMNWILEKHYGIQIKGWLDEPCENQFVVLNGDDLETVKSKLINFGVVYREDINWMAKI